MPIAQFCIGEESKLIQYDSNIDMDHVLEMLTKILVEISYIKDWKLRVKLDDGEVVIDNNYLPFYVPEENFPTTDLHKLCDILGDNAVVGLIHLFKRVYRRINDVYPIKVIVSRQVKPNDYNISVHSSTDRKLSRRI